jgi:hypothetical protein
MRISVLFRVTGSILLTTALAVGASLDSLKAGQAQLKSAGPLAFGPDAILFAGDSVGGALFAFDTNDRTPAGSAAAVDIKGINQKIAAALGTTPDQILVADAVVNPVSKSVYLSVSRGRGPDAVAVILKADAAGKITELSLDNIRHASVRLPDQPADNPSARTNPRMETITDLAFVNGNVIVAGLSNEEFASTLRSIPFPFQQAAAGAGIEIFHGSHGRFETNAPIRTFVPYEIAGQPTILAAYTCTPLVKIPVSELKPGNKVKGVTIAEMGNRNRPLDMIAYSKGGKQYFLMANSSRGVMKFSAEKLESHPAITSPVDDQAGVPYETLADLKGVMQLDKFDDGRALLLTDSSGTLDLQTVPLP